MLSLGAILMMYEEMMYEFTNDEAVSLLIVILLLIDKSFDGLTRYGRMHS